MANATSNRPPFEIPANYKKAYRWLRLTLPLRCGDGEARHWPGKPTYRPSTDVFYLCTLGQKWASKQGITQQGVQFYLDRLPDGYATFETDQISGTQIYRRLFGHPSGRFYDSVLTFEPHFFWLLSDRRENCTCRLCGHKKPIVPRPRVPRELESLKTSISNPPNPIRIIDDSSDEANVSRTSSTTRDVHANRSQRQVRQQGINPAVDEEGQEDVYKDCVRRLENARGDARSIEIDITEEGSIDWKAERQSLPPHLVKIEQQHSFTPRLGELVLWCPEFLDDHFLMLDYETLEYKFYSFGQRHFHGFPNWRGGIVTAVPSAGAKNGKVDFSDILNVPPKQTAFNSAGFRIETMPDPNDEVDKSASKQYRYVPLRNIRPLNHWQLLLRGIPRSTLHPSIENALTCMTSISLLEKWRFNGNWPNAQIFCKGIYLGSELITIGDTVRLLPLAANHKQPDILIVDSIRYNLIQMRPEHTSADTPQLCSKSYITFIGSAYTINRDKLPAFQNPIQPGDHYMRSLSPTEVKTLFRAVGTGEYGAWYPWHGPKQKYEVSHEQVAGRLHEAGAVRLWTGHKQVARSSTYEKPPSLTYDIPSILAGRRYASAADARLSEPQPNAPISWLLADTRAQALGVATFNGIEVGPYHHVRTMATLKNWRAQVKLADGQQLTSDIASEFITDLSQLQLYTGAKRGRPAGSKLVNGKLVRPQDFAADSEDSSIREETRPKHSSQLAGAALASDSEDSSTDESGSGTDESQDRHKGLRNDHNDFDNEDTIQVFRPQATPGRDQIRAQTRPELSKTAIMTNAGAIDGQSEYESSDPYEEEDEWNQAPLYVRGGTEESEGGDYREEEASP